MQSITNQQLQDWNEQGLIPGPDETNEQFLNRINLCQSMQWEKHLPFNTENRAPETIARHSLRAISTKYDAAPHWVPLFFSNYRLAPWQGAATWILGNEDGIGQCAAVQLREAFKNSTAYLKIYGRDEIITHELAHAGRIAFDEPKFEEILAYRLSPSRFRRFWGPLLQSPWEGFVLVLLLILAVGLLPFYPGVSALFYAVAALDLALMAGRLLMRHKQFDRCVRLLNKIARNAETADAIAYRMTDEEIIHCGKWSQDQLLAYIAEQKGQSLRWRTIAAAYAID
jgi:hypothetical protein